MEEESEDYRHTSIDDCQMKISLGVSKSTRKQWRPTNQPPKGIILEEEAVKSNFHLKFSCDFCGYSAKQLHTLQVHGQMNHLSLVFQCNICDFALKEKYTIRKHVSETHSITNEVINDFIQIECGVCQNTGNVDETMEHISQKHPNFTQFLHAPERKIPNYVRMGYKCPFCNEDFSNLPRHRGLHLKGHLQTVHVRSLFKCEQCSFQSRTLPSVRSHIHNSHNFPINLDTYESKELTRLHIRHKCNVCGFELSDSEKDKMLDHMKSDHINHLLKTEFRQCDKCNFQSSTRKKMKVHKNSAHPNTANHKCPLCDHESNIRGNFLLHLHNHIGTTYICKDCDFQSRRRKEFKTHYSTEHMNGEESFSIIDRTTVKCTSCNIETKGRNYHNHMIQKHNFPILKQLLWRKDMHSSEKQSKHKCSLCEYQTNIKNYFVMHMERHIETMYLCNHCEYQSKDRRFFVKHTRDQHKDEYADKQTRYADHMTCKCTTCEIETTGTTYKDHMIQVHKFLLHDERFLYGSKESLHGKSNGSQKSKSSSRNKDYSNYKHKCPTCEFGSMNKFNLILHLHKHIGTTYKCNICELETKYRTQLRSHFKDKHIKEYTGTQNWIMDKVTWKCQACILQTNGKEYKIHMMIIHNFNIKDRRLSEARRSFIPNKIKLFTLKCPKCKYGTNLMLTMREHMFTHIRTLFSCYLCKEPSQRRGITLNHVMEKHKKEVRLNPNNWISKYVLGHCTSCNVTLSSIELDEHLVRIHSFPSNKKAPMPLINTRSLRAQNTAPPSIKMKKRSPKDIGLMLKLAELPIAVNVVEKK